MKNFKTTLIFKFTTTILALFVLITCFSACKSDDDAAVELKTSSVEYEVHNGQTVESAPYGGSHNDDFKVTMQLEELENGNTKITMNLENTIDGETYHMHAHDAADPATTPNGTPYNESANSDVFVQTVVGNGGTVSVSQEATLTYDVITSTYDAFFVVHDPLQDVSTTDITSYLVVGKFARTQPMTNYQTATFAYDFNIGQIAAGFLYVGAHPTNVSAEIKVAELASGSRITLSILNSLNGETYNTHAHDAADAATTPNGTPYDESPNGDVYARALIGNGGTVSSASITTMSYSDITSSYEGFIVVHDPLQTVTTVDPTTYIILGLFAR